MPKLYSPTFINPAEFAEARAPLIVESANFYDDGPELDGDEGLELPDPLDDLSDEEERALLEYEASQSEAKHDK